MPSQGDWGAGTLRCHSTLRRETQPLGFSSFGWSIEGPPATVLLWTDGSPQVFVETEEMSAAFAAVEAGENPAQDETVLDLLNIGALVWLPNPRRD